MEKIRYNNDYNHGAHPAVLKALVDTNNQSFGGYSEDEMCEAAAKMIKEYIGNEEAIVHFLVGGTQANVIGLLAGLTRPYQAIICPDSGHINEHESGSIEATGHKLLQLPGTDGKITAAQIDALAEVHATSEQFEHIVEPKCVYISLPTEYGTTYTLAELEAIREVCDKYGFYLFIDGARLGYGLAARSCDITMKDLGRLADAFYIGGTKCGAMFGEAVVLNNPELNKGFRNIMKMHGAMLAKGWTMGVQFMTLFENGLYFEITDKAVRLADQINAAFKAKGVKAFMDSADTNQLFYILTDEQFEKLDEGFIFANMGKIGDNQTLVRFCTSWATTQEEADALVAAVNQL
ncbi:MAG: aminotransferase class I/II-fold pyridoxal phosphate-dependent enzyme [Clostridiales bacterium]|nr:aminotransferase class I/II-fold pyridoxal phosphate-dependent enzyme [Candidatus Crickella merdequi]